MYTIDYVDEITQTGKDRRRRPRGRVPLLSEVYNYRVYFFLSSSGSHTAYPQRSTYSCYVPTDAACRKEVPIGGLIYDCTPVGE